MRPLTKDIVIFLSKDELRASRSHLIKVMRTIPANIDLPKEFEHFVDSLISSYHPEKVILFGSHARGEAGRGSDVDLLVIMEHEARKNVDAAVDLYMDLRPAFPMDLLVRRPQDISDRLKIGDKFIGDIVHHGIVLHDAKRPGMD
jgi:predicted nucleotidyltransferase